MLQEKKAYLVHVKTLEGFLFEVISIQIDFSHLTLIYNVALYLNGQSKL